MKKIKVLHIISSGGIYGSENVILPWMKYTPNVLPYLLVFGPVDELKSPFAQKAAEQGVGTAVISLKRMSILRTLKQSFAFIDRCGPDIIHSHGYKGLFYGRLISWRYHLGLVHTNHGFVDTTLKKRINNRVELFISRFFPPDFIVAIAQNVKSRFLSFGVKREILTVLTNAISVDTPSEEMPVAIPDDLAPHVGSRRIVLYVGRLSYEKGPDILILAASKVLSSIPDAFFILAGDGPMRRELENLVENLGIGGSLRMLGYRSDIGNLMRSSEVLVMPSRSEATPITLLEGMRSGKAIIASRVGDIPDVITHEAEGILVPKERVTALSSSICRVLTDQDLAKRIGKAAAGKVARNFNINDRVARLFSIYRQAYRTKDSRGVKR